MLQRKERRIQDLEAQLTDLAAENSNNKFKLSTVDADINTLKLENMKLNSENLRLSTSYTTLQSSISEYKLNMNNTVSAIRDQLSTFILQQDSKISSKLNDLSIEQPNFSLNYNTLLQNSKRLDSLYTTKFDKVSNQLLNLANETKNHAVVTSIIFDECEDIFKSFDRSENVLKKLKKQASDSIVELESMNKPSSRLSSPVITQERRFTSSNNKNNRRSMHADELYSNQTINMPKQRNSSNYNNHNKNNNDRRLSQNNNSTNYTQSHKSPNPQQHTGNRNSRNFSSAGSVSSFSYNGRNSSGSNNINNNKTINGGRNESNTWRRNQKETNSEQA